MGMKIQNIEIKKLKPYPNNARKNKDAIAGVAESIKQFGFNQPIVIDKNMEIIAGHTRLEASKLLGLKVVPCYMAEGLTEDQIKAYRILDNKLAEKSEWDYDMLEKELDGMDFDFSKFGEDFDGLQLEIDEKVEENKNKNKKEESDCVIRVLFYSNNKQKIDRAIEKTGEANYIKAIEKIFEEYEKK